MTNFQRVYEEFYLVDEETLEAAALATSRGKVLLRLGLAFGAQIREASHKGQEVARALGWNGKDITDLRSIIQDLLEEYKEAGVLDTL